MLDYSKCTIIKHTEMSSVVVVVVVVVVVE
jgi:hypothetical protein